MNLSPELSVIKDEIQGYAKEYGLDFFETIFEMVTFEQMNELAAYTGFPTRYPHWKFGMEYNQLSKGYAYGLQKIYEMVINTSPSYTYLLNCNNLVDQKIVMAHVYGHVDFFKNNFYFSQTNRKMMDEMANHGTLVRKHIDKYGYDKVEQFIDICHSIEDLIDVHSVYFPKSKVEDTLFEKEEVEKPSNKFKSKYYMDDYINPKDILEKESKELEEKLKNKKYPLEPQKDILQFLLDHAPLEKWQYEILSLIREEAYYFAPQAMTKIMNEGWATVSHTRLMTQKILSASEVIDYADHHSGTVATSRNSLNPYKLGLELFRNIEERWNKGQFGKEYDECDNLIEKKNWNKKLNLGKQKIFEVRKFYNDIAFLDEFLTPEFCREQNLFSYNYNEDESQWEVESREFKKIKERLLFRLTNFGHPIILVDNINYNNSGALLLVHKFEGIELDLNYARETIKNIYALWRRPVYINTMVKEDLINISYDGSQIVISSVK